MGFVFQRPILLSNSSENLLFKRAQLWKIAILRGPLVVWAYMGCACSIDLTYSNALGTCSMFWSHPSRTSIYTHLSNIKTPISSILSYALEFKHPKWLPSWLVLCTTTPIQAFHFSQSPSKQQSNHYPVPKSFTVITYNHMTRTMTLLLKPNLDHTTFFFLDPAGPCWSFVLKKWQGTGQSCGNFGSKFKANATLVNGAKEINKGRVPLRPG